MTHTTSRLRTGLAALMLTAVIAGCQPTGVATHPTPRPVHTVTTSPDVLAADKVNATELREQSVTAIKVAHAKVLAEQAAAKAAADAAAKAAADAAAKAAADAAAAKAAAAKTTTPKSDTTGTKPPTTTASKPNTNTPATVGLPPNGSTIHISIQSCSKSGTDYVLHNVTFSYSSGWHETLSTYNIGGLAMLLQITVNGTNIYDIAEDQAVQTACDGL